MSDGFETLTMTRGEWLDFRRSHMGGSDAAAVMGLPGAFGTAYQVWAEKTGLSEPEDLSDNPRVEWGTRLERVVAEKFRDSHPDLGMWLQSPGEQTVLVATDRPWAMATLDGIVSEGPDERAVLEIKTAHYPASQRWGESGTGAKGVPPHYLAQVNHYLCVTGWNRAYVAVLIDGCDYREYVVERDQGDVCAVAEAVDRFWRGNVQAGVPPEVASVDAGALLAAHDSPTGDYLDGDASQLEMVEEWREAVSRESRAKREAASLAARLKAAIGDSPGLAFPEGRLTWSRKVSRRFDAKSLRADDPDLYERYRTDAVSQRLTWKEA